MRPALRIVLLAPPSARTTPAPPPPMGGWGMIITIADTTHTLRLNAACTFDVDWGDGTRDTLTSTTAWTYTKTYAAPGTYRLRFSIQSGTFYPFYNSVTADAAELRTLEGTGPEAWSFGTSLFRAFHGASGLTEVSGGMNTAGVTNFSQAWRQCTSLASFPVLNVSSVTNFGEAWSGCSSLTSFPLLDVSSGTNFGQAWTGCSSLTSFPLLNTANATNISAAWQNCSSLTSFPLLNTALVTSMGYAWWGCNSLTSFPLLNTASVTNMGNAWQGCSSLTSFPSINTEKVTNINATWAGCSSLTSFPATLNLPVCTSVGSAFYGCFALSALPDISSCFPVLTNGFGAFGLCHGATSHPFGSTINLPSCTTLQQAFASCRALPALPDIIAPLCASAAYLFQDMRAMTTAPAFTFAANCNLSFLFTGCTALTTVAANMFNGYTSTAMGHLFSTCALTAQSIENVLVSVNSNGTSNGTLSLGGGTNAAKTSWSGTANAAFDALVARGWTINFNP